MSDPAETLLEPDANAFHLRTRGSIEVCEMRFRVQGKARVEALDGVKQRRRRGDGSAGCNGDPIRNSSERPYRFYVVTRAGIEPAAL